MQIEPAGGEIVARAGCAKWPGNAPVLPIQLGQRAARGEAGQLLKQQAPLSPAGQSKFADQLLVSGLSAGGAGDPRHQFTIGHRTRLGYERSGAQQQREADLSVELGPCVSIITKVLSL